MVNVLETQAMRRGDGERYGSMPSHPSVLPGPISINARCLTGIGLLSMTAYSYQWVVISLADFRDGAMPVPMMGDPASRLSLMTNYVSGINHVDEFWMGLVL